MVLGKIIKNPFISLLLHYLAWIALYVLTYLPIIISNPNPNFRSIQWEHLRYDNIILGTVNFALFALVAFVLIPLFLKKRKWGLLILICISLATVFCFIKFNLDNWHSPKLNELIQNLNQKRNQPDTFIVKKSDVLKNSSGQIEVKKDSTKAPMPSVKAVANKNIALTTPMNYKRFKSYFFINIWFNLVIVIMAFGYALLLQWFLQERIRRRLESEKLTAELSFLKMQINPHFLFNTLNNIYSLSLKKSESTPDSILKLSEMMRYMLYEKEDAEYKVPLDKEIKYLENFIVLQRIRYSWEIEMLFEIKGITANKKICPLILVPFVENAFKHGVLNDAANPLSIQLKTEDNKLIFAIDNKINNHNNKDLNGGIGLANVKKRLELLYPGKHTLETTITNSHYNTVLTLTL